MTSVYPVVYIQTPLLSQISGKGNVFKLFLHKNTDEKKKSLSCLVKKKTHRKSRTHMYWYQILTKITPTQYLEILNFFWLTISI